MKFKMLLCEACDNLISVKQVVKPTFTCPVCGCINDRIRKDIFRGAITAISPKYTCETDKDTGEDSVVPLMLTDMKEDVYEAMLILVENGWSIKFQGTKKL